jgi:ketosteroid isomerase-like protein
MTAKPNELGVRTNIDVVQETYEAVGRGDIPAVLDLLTDDVEWTLQGPCVIPFAGTRHGREGVAEFFSLVGENLEFQQFEPREFVAQGDTVAVPGYERSLIKLTGRTLEQEWAHVYTLRDGKIAKFRAFEDTAALVVAFGAG